MITSVGDWDSVTENSSTQSRTHGPTHELLTVASQSVSTDTKGNMTSIPAVLRPGSDPLALTWDMDNRLSAADVDDDQAADVSYQFNALGRRVVRDDGTATTIYVQAGQQTIADYASGAAASSPTYTYYYASYIDEPVMRAGVGPLRYYHRGQQYSVVALTGSNGNMVERYAYDAYGSPSVFDGSGSALTSSVENNRYLYTGREWDDEVGLYHYRARMYDSVSGRFCSRDPIGFTDGYNLYRVYFILDAVDPSGLKEGEFPGKPKVVGISTNVIKDLETQEFPDKGTLYHFPGYPGGRFITKGACADYASDMQDALDEQDIDYILHFYYVTPATEIKNPSPNGRPIRIRIRATRHIRVEVKCKCDNKVVRVFFDAGAGSLGNMQNGNLGDPKTGVIASGQMNPRDINTDDLILLEDDPRK